MCRRLRLGVMTVVQEPEGEEEDMGKEKTKI
jgi:hypothetical protein